MIAFIFIEKCEINFFLGESINKYDRLVGFWERLTKQSRSCFYHEISARFSKKLLLKK